MGGRPCRIEFAPPSRHARHIAGEVHIPGSEAASSVKEWLQDSFLGEDLLAFYERLTGDRLRPPTEAQISQSVLPVLRSAFEQATLVAYEREPPPSYAAKPKAPAAPPPKAPSAPPKIIKEKSFIDVTVVDEKGRPVAGLKYKFQSPSGLAETSHLGGDAHLYQGNLDPGTGRLTLLREDGEPLSAANPSAGPGPGFVSFRVVNQMGDPLPGVRYEVTAADGTVFSGETDAFGGVFVGDLEPGDCDLSLPDLADELWSSA
jgi:hypothetical protein